MYVRHSSRKPACSGRCNTRSVPWTAGPRWLRTWRGGGRWRGGCSQCSSQRRSHIAPRASNPSLGWSLCKGGMFQIKEDIVVFCRIISESKFKDYRIISNPKRNPSNDSSHSTICEKMQFHTNSIWKNVCNFVLFVLCMPLSFNKCFISVNLKTWSPEGTKNPKNPQNLHDGDRTRAEEGKHL